MCRSALQRAYLHVQSSRSNYDGKCTYGGTCQAYRNSHSVASRRGCSCHRPIQQRTAAAAAAAAAGGFLSQSKLLDAHIFTCQTQPCNTLKSNILPANTADADRAHHSLQAGKSDGMLSVIHAGNRHVMQHATHSTVALRPSPPKLSSGSCTC
jgi:hypothetical protein